MSLKNVVVPSQRVHLGESLSQQLSLSHGVPQGSILGPLMFIVYGNDLPSIVVNCKPECYVDDSKLYISFLVNNLDLAIEQINKDLDQLCCWCCGNSLLVNPEKTKVLVLGTRQRLQQLPNFSIKFLLNRSSLFLLRKTLELSWIHAWLILTILQQLSLHACIHYFRLIV
jgi:hypothetical protein